MEEAPGPKLDSKKKELVSLIIEGVLLCAFLGVAAHVWSTKHATVTTNTRTVEVSGKPQPSASATPLPVGVAAASSTEKLVIPMDQLAAGYSLLIDVPVAWRGVDIRDLVSLSDYPNYNGNDLAAILRFVPENPGRVKSRPAVEPVNSLDVLATAKWASVSEDGVTAASKQAYLSYVASLKTVDDITAKKCTPITSDGSSVCVDKKVKPQIIRTSDGTLSGLAYLYMQTQSASYDPSVVVELVGTVAGKPVRVSGTFRLYDKLYGDLAGGGNVEAARKAFSDGNPAADTLAMYDRIAVAVRSMKFQK